MSKPYRDSKGRFRKKPSWIITLLALILLYGLLSFIFENIGTVLIIVAVAAVAAVGVILLRRSLRKRDAADQAAAKKAEIAEKQKIADEKRYTCPHCGADTKGPACEYCGRAR